MEIKEEKAGIVKVVGLQGRLDASTAPGVEKRLLDIINQGDIRVVLDFSELTYISSLGLRVLIAAAKQVQRSDGKLALAAITDHILEIFKLAAFTSIFAIYPTREEAINFCAG